jgi:hypothetical protein
MSTKDWVIGFRKFFFIADVQYFIHADLIPSLGWWVGQKKPKLMLA